MEAKDKLVMETTEKLKEKFSEIKASSKKSFSSSSDDSTKK